MEDSEPAAAKFVPLNKYFDRLAITIFEVEHPMTQCSNNEWHLVLSSAETVGGVDLNSIEEAVEKFLREHPDVTGAHATRFPPNYQLHISKNHFNWGASAVVVDVIIGVSAWIGTNLAWEALKSLALRLTGRAFDKIEIEPLTEVEAVRVAKHEIYRRHAVSPDLLLLTSAEVSADNQARLAFVDHNDVDYDVRMAKVGDIATIANILRRFPESDGD